MMILETSVRKDHWDSLLFCSGIDLIHYLLSSPPNLFVPFFVILLRVCIGIKSEKYEKSDELPGW